MKNSDSSIFYRFECDLSISPHSPFRFHHGPVMLVCYEMKELWSSLPFLTHRDLPRFPSSAEPPQRCPTLRILRHPRRQPAVVVITASACQRLRLTTSCTRGWVSAYVLFFNQRHELNAKASNETLTKCSTALQYTLRTTFLTTKSQINLLGDLVWPCSRHSIQHHRQIITSSPEPSSHRQASVGMIARKRNSNRSSGKRVNLTKCREDAS